MVGLEDMKKAVLDAGYQFLGLAGEEAVADREREPWRRIGEKKRASSSAFPSALSHGHNVPAVHEIVP